MAKATVRFVCQACGYSAPKWQGRCPECGEWNSLVEEAVRETKTVAQKIRAGNVSVMGATASRPRPVTEIEPTASQRESTGVPEFDRVLGGGIVPGSLTLIGGDPGIGKCLTGDQRVFDPQTGDYLPIAQWAERCGTVAALDTEALKLKTCPVGAFLDQGVRPIVEVRTRMGRRLRCTPNHPIYTIDGWKPVGSLSAGSRIAAPRKLSCSGSESLPQERVRLIAYMLSDGSARGQLSITSMLPEVAEDVQQIAAHFGMCVRTYTKPRNRASQYRFTVPWEERGTVRAITTRAIKEIRTEKGISLAEWARCAEVPYRGLVSCSIGKMLPTLEVARALATAIDISVERILPEGSDRARHKTAMAAFLEELGLRYTSAATKFVPDVVFRLPEDSLRDFLKVLFSCDGSVYFGRVVGVSYSTISRRLAEDVQHLLLRFGITMKLREKPMIVAGKPYAAYELQLLGLTEVKAFLSKIGIYGRREAIERILTTLDPEGGSTHFDTVPIPEDFWTYLRACTGRALRRTVKERAGVVLYPRRPGRPLTKRILRSLADAFPDPYFSRLACNDLFWDEIESITDAGEERVYDLCIPDGNSFIASDLVVHNSTLLGSVAGNLARNAGTVLYVSGEESVEQIKLRSTRLGATHERLLIASETDVAIIAGFAEQFSPAAMVIDSIQTMTSGDVESAPGTVSQVRAATAALAAIAKGRGVPIFLVGHVTKEGAIAGPRVLEHMVDTVLYFEGDAHLTYRILRAVKNRFGSTDELGIFEMREEGLVGVENPSAAFLSERPVGAPGSTVTAALEGSRALLVEVQALVAPSPMNSPRRMTNGVSKDRVALVLAVLEKRLGLSLANMDVYVSVAGGVTVEEPAADLAIALAVAGNYLDRPVDAGQVFVGEIGLSGEVRSCPQVEKRLKEAAGLGFKSALIPARNVGKSEKNAGLDLVGIDTLRLAVEKALLAPKG